MNRKKQRIYIFLLGMMTSVFIILICFIVYVSYFNKGLFSKLTQSTNAVKVENKIEKKKVIVAIQPVKKGQAINKDMVILMDIFKNYLPANTLDSIDVVNGKIANIDLEPNTILTSTMVSDISTFYHEDERLKDYEIQSNIGLTEGKFIDVEFVKKDGTTCVVLAKKKVIRVLEGGKIVFQTSLRERQLMNRAMQEIKDQQGGKLDISVYLDDLQPASQVTYNPSGIKTVQQRETTPVNQPVGTVQAAGMIQVGNQ